MNPVIQPHLVTVRRYSNQLIIEGYKNILKESEGHAESIRTAVWPIYLADGFPVTFPLKKTFDTKSLFRLNQFATMSQGKKSEMYRLDHEKGKRQIL